MDIIATSCLVNYYEQWLEVLTIIIIFNHPIFTIIIIQTKDAYLTVRDTNIQKNTLTDENRLTPRLSFGK